MLTEKSQEDYSDNLKAGTELHGGDYVIEAFLNSGGFGITYLARDTDDKPVVIKECFPNTVCRRSQTLAVARMASHADALAQSIHGFRKEAENLQQLGHPNIVRVHDVFDENNTTYMVIDHIDGLDLQEMIQRAPALLTPEFLTRLLKKLLSAVAAVHDRGMLHRDISPDNILLTQENEPILIDFGAARGDVSQHTRVLSTLNVVKDGYSPQEFYLEGSFQDASSDLYALAATFYHCVSGEAPPHSQKRLFEVAKGSEGSYKPLAGKFEGYPKNFLGAIDKALQVMPEDRLQSAAQWSAIIDPNNPASLADLVKPVARKSAGTFSLPMMGAGIAAIGVLGLGGYFLTGFAPGQTGADVAASEAPTQEQVLTDPAPLADAAAAVVQSQPTISVDPQDTTIAAAAIVTVEEPTIDADEDTQVAMVDTDDLPVVDVPVVETAPLTSIVQEEPTISLDEQTSAVVVPTVEPQPEPAPADLIADVEPTAPDVIAQDAEPEAPEAEAQIQTVARIEPKVDPAPEVAIVAEDTADVQAPVRDFAPTTDAVDFFAGASGDTDRADADVVTQIGPKAFSVQEALPDSMDADTKSLAPIFELVSPQIAQPKQVETASFAPASSFADLTPKRAVSVAFGDWALDLPFMVANLIVDGKPSAFPIVTAVRQGADLAFAGSWINPGVTIYSIDGALLPPADAVPAFMTNMFGKRSPNPITTVARVSVGAGAPATDMPLRLGFARTLQLSNGLEVKQQLRGNLWQLVVTQTSVASGHTVQVGDVLVSETANGIQLASLDDFTRMMIATKKRGASAAALKITRGGAAGTAEISF